MQTYYQRYPSEVHPHLHLFEDKLWRECSLEYFLDNLSELTPTLKRFYKWLFIRLMLANVGRADVPRYVRKAFQAFEHQKHIGGRAYARSVEVPVKRFLKTVKAERYHMVITRLLAGVVCEPFKDCAHHRHYHNCPLGVIIEYKVTPTGPIRVIRLNPDEELMLLWVQATYDKLYPTLVNKPTLKVPTLQQYHLITSLVENAHPSTLVL